jgi:hypothetical protein
MNLSIKDEDDRDTEKINEVLEYYAKLCERWH